MAVTELETNNDAHFKYIVFTCVGFDKESMVVLNSRRDVRLQNDLDARETVDMLVKIEEGRRARVD